MKKILTVTAVAALALIAVPASAQVALETQADLRLNAEVRANLIQSRESTSTREYREEKMEDREERMEERRELVNTKVTAQLSSRANEEIAKRIDSLNKLSARIAGMERVSTSTRAQLSAQIQSQITALNTLKAEIAVATSTAALRVDVKSITQMHRIYGLILPQIQLLASADRLNSVAADMAIVGSKFQARIDAARAGDTSGSLAANITSAQASITAYNAKVAQAVVHAQAAITATASLTPDNGDETKAKANKAAMTKAREEIRLGTKALNDARKEAGNLVKTIKSLGIKVNAKGDLKATTTATSTSR